MKNGYFNAESWNFLFYSIQKFYLIMSAFWLHFQRDGRVITSNSEKKKKKTNDFRIIQKER